MLNLFLGDTPIRVSFHHLPSIHPHAIVIYGPDRQKVIYHTKGAKGHTTCFIRVGDPAGSGYTVHGESTIVPADHLNKACGRRIALQAALLSTDFSTAEREFIWTAYRNLSRA